MKLIKEGWGSAGLLFDNGSDFYFHTRPLNEHIYI